MIQIDLVDYNKITDLGMQITKYVNKNLKDIICVLIDVLETDPDFELDGFFPRDYLERKPQECKNAVYELYELICSANIRDSIKPKYEYLLYAILSWWEDCVDSEEDLIINLLDDQLRNALDNEEDRTILKCITDYEAYYYFCFEDYDFLPFQLSNLVALYLRNPELAWTFLRYDNLDNYLDLMDCDLRERYLEVRHRNENRNHTSLSQNIIMEICCIIRRFQKRISHFEKRDEVQITADLHDSVQGILNSKYGLSVCYKRIYNG